MSMLRPQWLEELPEVAISDQSSLAVRTGSWKSVEPRYEDKFAPCSHICPAGNDIPRMITLLAAGKIGEAAALLRSTNPLPATLGRVCPHFCEGPCNRESFGGAIAVHMLERFLGDSTLSTDSHCQPVARTGKSVAVIGSGPAGIAAAYTLALRGHDVEVFDDKPEAGGYLRTGIPDYRLPKEVLDREIARVQQCGVRFTQNTRIGRDLSMDDLLARFDAVITAVGLHKSRGLNIPGSEHANVFNGVNLLERILSGNAPQLPSTLAVIGGGNTAMDVARSVLRLGVRPIVVYRRTEAEMPAIATEVQEAKLEGVEFTFLASPEQIIIENGQIVALACVRMQLGEPDASGRRAPVAIPNSEFRVPVSGVVTATGESADLAFVSKEASASDKYFVAGDAATGEGTVTAAIGDGRRVAAAVDSYLRSGIRAEQVPALATLLARKLRTEKVVEPKLLNSAYFRCQPQHAIRSSINVQPTSFDEIVQGFEFETAIAEARRCLSCGTCNHCLNCYYFCPDVAVHFDPNSDTLTIDAEHCKGCGICVEECPRAAMTLGEVSR